MDNQMFSSMFDVSPIPFLCPTAYVSFYFFIVAAMPSCETVLSFNFC
jgi:hypothetical protein